MFFIIRRSTRWLTTIFSWFSRSTGWSIRTRVWSSVGHEFLASLSITPSLFKITHPWVPVKEMLNDVILSKLVMQEKIFQIMKLYLPWCLIIYHVWYYIKLVMSNSFAFFQWCVDLLRNFIVVETSSKARRCSTSFDSTKNSPWFHTGMSCATFSLDQEYVA